MRSSLRRLKRRWHRYKSSAYLQNVTDFKFEPDRAGHLSLSALVHNEGSSDVASAGFSFDFLADEHFKIGEGWANIGRLIHGDTEKILINISTPGLKIDDIHGIRLVRISCFLSG